MQKVSLVEIDNVSRGDRVSEDGSQGSDQPLGVASERWPRQDPQADRSPRVVGLATGETLMTA